MRPWLPMIAFVLLWPGYGTAQDATSLLTKLSAEAKEYQRAIPDFTCTEVVTSMLKRDNKVIRRIEFQADIRVKRKEDKSLEETFWITSYMGKPTPQGGRFPIPLYMTGGLSKGMPSFFDEGSHACYEYQASGNRVDFHAKDVGATQCRGSSETTGFGLLDAQGKLLEGEIRTPPAEAARYHNPAVGSIQYADVRLNDRVFRMPTHVYGEDLHDGTTRTFDAYYTGCKLFSATATIVSSTEGAAAP